MSTNNEKRFWAWSAITLASAMGTAIILLLCALLFSGCAMVSGTVIDEGGPVYLEEELGSSYYHRTLLLNNGRPYPIAAVVDCNFYPSRKRETFAMYAEPNSKERADLYFPFIPHERLKNVDFCELVTWKRDK